MSSQETKYLVVQRDYEGIANVFGLFTREEAVAFTIEKRSQAELRRKVHVNYDELEHEIMTKFESEGIRSDEAFDRMREDPRISEFEKENSKILNDFGPTDPDFYCVSTVSPEGTRCVCEELGVKPSKLMLRYQ